MSTIEKYKELKYNSKLLTYSILSSIIYRGINFSNDEYKFNISLNYVTITQLSSNNIVLNKEFPIDILKIATDITSKLTINDTKKLMKVRPSNSDNFNVDTIIHIFKTISMKYIDLKFEATPFDCELFGGNLGILNGTPCKIKTNIIKDNILQSFYYSYSLSVKMIKNN